MLLNLDFFICDHLSFLQIMNFIIIALNIIRYTVPILVIVMTILDLYKNIINPNNKEGFSIIIKRVLAAVIVFLVPTFVKLFMSLLDIIFQDTVDINYTSCYINANTTCIENVKRTWIFLSPLFYKKCDDFKDSELKKQCLAFRTCNSYSLSSDCRVTTEFDNESCLELNQDASYSRFQVFNYKK